MDALHAAEKLKGFGSSDAAAIIHYANTKEMSNTLLRRIGEIKGQVERDSFTSKYTDLGNTVEEDLHKEYEFLYGDGVKNNPKHYYPQPYVNFTISCHIDFTLDASIEGKPTWVELKAVKRSNPSMTDEDFKMSVFNKYYGQLAWHSMIMYKNDPEAKLLLKVYETTDVYKDHSLYKFDAFNFDDLEILPEMVMDDINRIVIGLDMLDQAWDDIEPYTEKEVVVVSESEYQQMDAYLAIRDLVREEASIKDRIKEFREQLLEKMEADGIKSIKTPDFTISYKSESTQSRIDSTKVKANLGDDYDSYTKTIKVKSSVSIKLNKTA